MQSRLPAARQRAFFCGCGRDLPSVAGLCHCRYRTAQHSRQRFAGLWEEILDRAGHLCQTCRSADRLHVHHQHPGVNDPDPLITVCPSCHALLHRLGALRVWVPEALVALWIEQHPGTPVPLQLPAAA